MIQRKKADTIEEPEKKFFKKRFEKFIQELRSLGDMNFEITTENPPHQKKSEADQFQETIDNFFKNSQGASTLLVAEEHHILISKSPENQITTLQWVDKGGLLSNPTNPKIQIPPNIEDPIIWAKNFLKLTYTGEITQKKKKTSYEDETIRKS